MANLAPELNEFAEELNSLSTTTASTSSVAIGTGTKNFTVETGKSLFVGMSYRIAYDANNWMNGEIISYNSGTGALSIDVDTVRGSGTYAAWVGTLSFNGQIETAQINDLAVTEAKLAATSVTVSKIAGAVFSLFRGYIDGLIMSTAGSSATMSIATGVAIDSTATAMMKLAASISKTTSAWAVGTGNGGLDTGTIANNTWYHFYEIMRTDTGVVDVVFSTSASAPTLPANYTLYRRIGSAKTNGSAQWTAFVQDGDYFRLRASVLDVNASNPGTSATLRTLASVPTGINVFAIFNGGVRNTASGVDAPCYFSDPAANDEAPSFTVAPLTSSPNTANSAGAVIDSYAQHTIRTNTSAQIRTRLLASDASTTLNIATLGWIDSRGRNA
jgi:hypothetical protein